MTKVGDAVRVIKSGDEYEKCTGVIEKIESIFALVHLTRNAMGEPLRGIYRWFYVERDNDLTFLESVEI